MRFKPEQVLKVLHVFAWIIFIGVCIEAGGILCNTIYAYVDGRNIAHFWNRVDLSSLYRFNLSYFNSLIVVMNIVSILKAFLMYLIVKIFHDKKLDLSSPFNDSLRNYLVKLSYVILGIGLASKYGNDLVHSIMNQGVNMPQIQDLKLGGYDVWILMFFILLVISWIFKRGIELQAESDLTV